MMEPVGYQSEEGIYTHYDKWYILCNSYLNQGYSKTFWYHFRPINHKSESIDTLYFKKLDPPNQGTPEISQKSGIRAQKKKSNLYPMHDFVIFPNTPDRGPTLKKEITSP